jgi:hypothetical protein
MVRDGAATMERWFFYQDLASLWKWARIDVFGTVLSYSGASFATRDECLEDARRSGYRENAARGLGAPVKRSTDRRTPLRVPSQRY